MINGAESPCVLHETELIKLLGFFCDQPQINRKISGPLLFRNSDCFTETLNIILLFIPRIIKERKI